MIFKKNKRKIDFIVGGTQKGGTSALDNYLRNHPEIGMGDKKELHFFDDENIFSNSKIHYSKYEQRFDFTAKKTIYGETTPIYIYWEPCCRRIWEYNPNIKLIFILRNPISRAFSHWNMQYDRKVDKEEFSYAIRNESLRIRESLPLQHRIYSYMDRSFYSEQIRRFRRYFNEEQLMFIKYEHFNKHQENVLKDIFHFLEVDSYCYVFKRQTVHDRKKHAEMSTEDKVYLLDKFEYEIRQVEKMLKWDCSDWLE